MGIEILENFDRDDFEEYVIKNETEEHITVCEDNYEYKRELMARELPESLDAFTLVCYLGEYLTRH